MTNHEKTFTQAIVVSVVIIFIACQCVFGLVVNCEDLPLAIYKIFIANGIVAVIFLIGLFKFRSDMVRIGVLRGILTSIGVPVVAIVLNFIPALFMTCREY